MCKNWQTWDNFYAIKARTFSGNTRQPYGHQARCKECTAFAGALRKFNLNRDRYLRLLMSQGGGCALCWIGNPAEGKLLYSIDHDHSCCDDISKGPTCGKCVRGLLCTTCNFMVAGIERDSMKFATPLVAEYLTRRPFSEDSI